MPAAEEEFDGGFEWLTRQVAQLLAKKWSCQPWMLRSVEGPLQRNEAKKESDRELA